MGKHDEQAMASGEVVQAFDRFVRLERDLAALLSHAVERDQQMLAAMRGQTTR